MSSLLSDTTENDVDAPQPLFMKSLEDQTSDDPTVPANEVSPNPPRSPRSQQPRPAFVDRHFKEGDFEFVSEFFPPNFVV